MEPNTDESQELFSQNKRNTNITYVGDTIMDAASGAIIDKKWILIDNQSSNVFINGKYLSNIIYAPDGQYLCVH